MNRAVRAVRAVLAVLVLALPAATRASTPKPVPTGATGDVQCAMSYAAFEHLVPHLDLPDCPAGLGGPNAFCRLAVSAEEAHVFVFDTPSGCLTGSRIWDADGFRIMLD